MILKISGASSDNVCYSEPLRPIQLGIPSYKAAARAEQTEAHDEVERERLLVEKKEQELHTAVKKLEEFVATKDQEIEDYKRDKDEQQRLVVQVRKESVSVKSKTG